MTLEASVTLLDGVKIQYLCTLVRGEALRQFDTLSAVVGSTTSENLKSIILGLGAYFSPVNSLSKEKRDAPRNEEDTRFKSKTLRCLYDWS